ncbi:MAG: hypothetical protein AB7K24_24065, partial [Gemmataceae bacterium]
ATGGATIADSQGVGTIQNDDNISSGPFLASTSTLDTSDSSARSFTTPGKLHQSPSPSNSATVEYHWRSGNRSPQNNAAWRALRVDDALRDYAESHPELPPDFLDYWDSLKDDPEVRDSLAENRRLIEIDELNAILEGLGEDV